jgi:hypothetical protein
MTSANTSKSSYDLNTLLSVTNILISGLTIYLHYVIGSTDYTNLLTVILICFFSIENILFLLYEKKRRNPFILILILVVTVFYMIRIPTLILMPSSAFRFELLSITVTDINYALTFILLANASMFLGFYIGTKHGVRNTNLTFSNDPNPKVKNAIIIISLVILMNFFDVLNREILGRLVGFATAVIFNSQIILLFTFSMLAYHYDNISKQLRILFIAISLCIILLLTLSGSRGGLLTVGMLFLFSVLAVKQKVMISKKLLLLILMVIPISLMFFVSATFKRQVGIQEQITIEHLYKAYDEEVFSSDRMKAYLGIIYYRIGFLDYSTEIIADRQKYSVILNGEYYIKSIIDNVLTPGFDVFGTPRVSHALSYISTGQAIPSRDQIRESYQSDQMGIYGEFYGLFYGFPALAALCFLAFIFQKTLTIFKTTNVLHSILLKAIMINLFYILLNSFGMDWFALDIIAAIITTFLFARFYVSGKKRKYVFRFKSKKKLGVYTLAR